jgi:lactoylglutathione lyase
MVGLGAVKGALSHHGVEAAPGSPAMVIVVWTGDVDEAFRDLLTAEIPVAQDPHDASNNTRNALARDPTAISWRSSPSVHERRRGGADAALR